GAALLRKTARSVLVDGRRLCAWWRPVLGGPVSSRFRRLVDPVVHFCLGKPCPRHTGSLTGLPGPLPVHGIHFRGSLGSPRQPSPRLRNRRLVRGPSRTGWAETRPPLVASFCSGGGAWRARKGTRSHGPSDHPRRRLFLPQHPSGQDTLPRLGPPFW